MDDLDDEENELELNDTDKLESWITWDEKRWAGEWRTMRGIKR